APDAVGIPGSQCELQAGFPDGAPDAERLRDGLARLFLGPFLEVGRGEEIRGVLPAADGPLPPGFDGDVHLPRSSRTAAAGIPPDPASPELHTGLPRRARRNRACLSRWGPAPLVPAPP